MPHTQPYALPSHPRYVSSHPSTSVQMLQGLSMGGRTLTQLRSAVHSLAGPEAVTALTIVLHLHEGQQQAALQDLHNRNCYGLQRCNVLLTVQKRQPGYRCVHAPKSSTFFRHFLLFSPCSPLLPLPTSRHSSI